MIGLNLKCESTKTDRGDVDVVAMEGYLDGHTAPKLMRLIDDLISQKHYRLVLDMSRLEYMSSAGFGILAATQKRTQAQGGDLKVVNLPEKIRRTFVTLGLENIIETHATREDAFAAFR
ncbi:MAG: STAS domain-containing protein [Planctomycetes bacterium]|nr:STAS domain-containing protein [Planctomycetota bacterium]MBM4078750.1 STAS domain-containing protein [Planctomycetota bacterium]MBM4085286.1 STAS domain-containing protein [Planctomycetota bacterium]